MAYTPSNAKSQQLEAFKKHLYMTSGLITSIASSTRDGRNLFFILLKPIRNTNRAYLSKRNRSLINSLRFPNTSSIGDIILAYGGVKRKTAPKALETNFKNQFLCGLKLSSIIMNPSDDRFDSISFLIKLTTNLEKAGALQDY